MEDNIVRIEDDMGHSFDMIILKEFDYKNEKYAVLMEDKRCSCHDECENEDDCKCDDTCDCGCKGECKCDDKCDCGCNDEAMLSLLHITKDKNGEEIFESIDDEKLFDEVVKEADKVLYE